MKTLSTNTILLFLILLITYPLFYFTYKYLDPYLVSHDLDHYLKMYEDFDIQNTETPFNTRLISTFLVFLLSKLNFSYQTDMVFHSDVINPSIYFSAFLVSYLCLILTIFVVYRLFLKLTDNHIISTVFAFIYLSSFGNFLYSLTPLTDSCGYLIGGLAIYYYVIKSRWLWFFLLLALVQREYILLGFGLISIYNFFMERDQKKYYLVTFIICVFTFCAYVLLRKIFLYSPKYDAQLNISEFLSRLISYETNWSAFIKQTFFIQNTLIIYLSLLIYKRIKKLSINRTDVSLVLLLLIQIVFFCLAGNLGNNGGRYFHLFTPLLLYYFYKELLPFLNPKTSKIASTEAAN